MPDYHALPIEELEKLCGKHSVELFRKIHRDPEAYRDALLRSLNRPTLPIEKTLGAIRGYAKPAEAWREILKICHLTATGAPWDRLPTPKINADIAAAHKWLLAQLKGLGPVTGIYLGPDTLNMEDGYGKNVEIGGTAECDPL